MSNVIIRPHHSTTCAKMAEPIDLPFGLWTRLGLKEAQVQSYLPGGATVPSQEGTLAPPGEVWSEVKGAKCRKGL